MGFRSAPDYGISASATCTGGALAGSVIVSPDGKSTTLARVTWTSADSTETEFVDQASGGKELTVPGGCSGTGAGQSRGNFGIHLWVYDPRNGSWE
jgi:hypothetical protein